MSKPMTLNEIAIDDEMNQMRDRIQRLIRERDEARADNARLTARVAELEANLENWENLAESFHIEYGELYAYTITLNKRETWYNSEIERLHAALDAQPAVLTPRNCETCRKAAEEMREAAAENVCGNFRLKCKDGVYREINLDCVAEIVRLIDLPSFCLEKCAGCAPLKPEA